MSEEYNCLQYLISKKTCSSKCFSPAGGSWNAEVSALCTLVSSLLGKSGMRYTQKHTRTQQKTVGHGLVMKSVNNKTHRGFVDAISRTQLYLLRKRNRITQMHQPTGNTKITTNYCHFLKQFLPENMNEQDEF